MTALASAVVGARDRILAPLGRLSMYRLTLLALALLAVIAFALSFAGLVTPGPLAIAATAAVLVGVGVAVDLLAQTLLRIRRRVESSLITAGILLFVLYPSVDPTALTGIALAAAVASASKYVLAVRGRHIFNPAAFGATVLTLVTSLSGVFALGAAAWWVGTPVLAAPVILLGGCVLLRAERLRPALLVAVVALALYAVKVSLAYASTGAMPDAGTIATMVLWSSPYLFLAGFMFSEPLTQPTRRWQQYLVAVVVGVFAGWPLAFGSVTIGAEAALVIGNLLAFVLVRRTGAPLVMEANTLIAPRVREVTLRAVRPVAFAPGQYVELEVPHRRPDARGTRREFSIVSAPEDLPLVRLAYRDGAEGSLSSYKSALAEAGPGTPLRITGVWGDFVLPRDASHPLLLVAAGIGVTPFVSHLRHLTATGATRDIVLVLVASDAAGLVFRDDIAAAGVPVIVVTRADPGPLPSGWSWAGGVRLDAETLPALVPDLGTRHAYISGPPGLIADLAPALARARSLTTDAFAGY